MRLQAVPKQWYAIAFLLLAYFVVALYPILESGFYSDDIYFWQGTRSKMSQEGVSLWKLVMDDTIGWMASARFAPLYYLQLNSVFYFAHHPLTYKLVVLASNLLAVASFGGFLYLLHNNKKLVLLTLVLLPAFFQFRVMLHDAYTTFNGFYQCIAILNFSALSLYILYLKRGKKYFLAGTVALLVASYCYTEMTLAFVPMYLVAVLLVPGGIKPAWQTVLRKLAPIAVVTALFFALTIYMRATQPTDRAHYEGLKISLKADKMLKVLHAQVFSAIPLSYLNYEKNFQRTELQTIWAQMKQHTPLLPIAFLLVLCLLFYNRYQTMEPAVNNSHKLFLWMGLLLLVLPAVMIMPSEKYQKFARPGNGYIPVYLQNMGAAMLFGVLLQVLLNSAGRAKRYAGKGLAVLFLLIVPITYANNMRLVAEENPKAFYPSLALEKALGDGLVAHIENNDVIWLVHNYHWGMLQFYQYLFAYQGGKHLEMYNQIAFDSLGADGRRVYQITFPPGNPATVTIKEVTGHDANGPIFNEQDAKRFVYAF